MILIILLTFGWTRAFADTTNTNIIDEENESQLIKIKENTAKTLEEYKQKYGSDAYGLTAYILNLIYMLLTHMHLNHIFVCIPLAFLLNFLLF